MRYALSVLLLAMGLCAHAQLDSLLRVLHQLPRDTSRLPVLTELLRSTVFHDPDSGLVFAAQYRALALAAGDSMELGKGHNYTGMCHSFIGEQDEALRHYLQALTCFEGGDDPWYTAMAHNNVATVMEKTGRMDDAAVVYRRALDGFRIADDPAWVANVGNNLGNVFHANGQLDSAIRYYEQTDSILMSLGERSFAAQVRMNLANSHFQKGHKAHALELIRGAVAMHSPEEDEVNHADLLLNLGRLQGENGIDDSALMNIRAGIALAQRVGSKQAEAEGASFLSDLYEQRGQADSALFHFKHMKELRDALFNEERAAQITEMKEKYESGRKDVLLAESRAQLERRALTIKAIAGGALLLLAAALFAYRAYRIKQRGEAELAQKNAVIEQQLREKELLVREIHHRVKNNLQTVSSLLSIQGRGITDEKARQAVNDGRLRVKSMALIHQDLYREGDLTGVRMKEYVEKLAGSLLSSYASSDRVELRCEVEDLSLDVDTAVPIGLILNELITNALKYAWPDARPGVLAITLGRAGDALRIAVRDDGVGYDPQATRSADGTGFGLGMIKTFASKLKAEWSIRNEAGTVVELMVRNFHLAA
ncbi:MAG: histidine kinase dimerization/phosphoacceptor domain -containing protein [Flavobacteriales bacterium]